jgi:DNA processing protein
MSAQAQQHNSQREIDYALLAQQLPELSLQVQSELLNHFPSYTDLFTAPIEGLAPQAELLLDSIRQKQSRPTFIAAVHRIQSLAQQVGAVILAVTSPDYPASLKQISGAPPILYVRGNTDCLHLPQIAIVGSRRMSRAGEANACQWGRYLALAGFTITSGLALGVDGAAHRGALEATGGDNAGRTVAVMATGIDGIYPRRHIRLAEQIIAENGALVTEFPPGSQPLAARFPQRNRIISGLSLGVLVVEAAVKSGSLITARSALEQGREVFAIPGSIHNPQSKGCHLLIKQGATLVETAQDIVTELAGPLAGLRDSASDAKDPTAQLSRDEAKLLACLGFDPLPIDGLDAGFPAAKLAQMLVGFELQGLIANDNGFYYRLV